MAQSAVTLVLPHMRARRYCISMDAMGELVASRAGTLQAMFNELYESETKYLCGPLRRRAE